MLILLFASFMASTCLASSLPSRTKSVLPNGRVVEQFGETFMATLDTDAAERLRQQSVLDEFNDQYTPQTNATANHTTETTILGEVSFSSIFAQSRYSVIFELNEHPTLLIKYQAQCDVDDDEIHPLLRDTWYGQIANEHGIAGRVVAISPPGQICQNRYGKCLFGMSDKDFAEGCRDGIIRYMMMEKIQGTNLLEFQRSSFALTAGRLGLHNALRLGVRLIEMLQTLHQSAQIVHGDIHAGNIMIGKGVSGLRLTFVDFGMSSKISNQTRLPETPVHEQGLWYHRSCTPWMIDGFAWARRDDVMKALYVTFQLMHSDEYMKYQTKLARRGYRSLMHWKKIGRMYVSPSFDPVNTLLVPMTTKNQIYTLLDKILDTSRRMTINESPPYSELISLMQRAIEL